MEEEVEEEEEEEEEEDDGQMAARDAERSAPLGRGSLSFVSTRFHRFSLICFFFPPKKIPVHHRVDLFLFCWSIFYRVLPSFLFGLFFFC